ncbi:MAG: methyltransferase domain-containing protein [Candidatus Bathyarchaeia archaeon]
MTEDYYTGSFAGLKEFWEEKGKTRSFEKEYSIRLEGIKQIVNNIHIYLQGRLVLDVGCGPGIAASLFPPNSRVIGLDFSVSMLKNARCRIHSLVQGSAFNLPFRNSSFDVITCLFVASDYSDKAGIFYEAHRVLQENGHFLFADYSLRDGHWKFKRAICPLFGERYNIFLTEKTSLLNEMRKAGFEIQETRRIRFRAPFKLKSYVRSKDELRKLKIVSLELWKDLQRCNKNKKIQREFILIIGTKKDDANIKH